MKEYFIDVEGEHKTHSLRVEANFTAGRPFVSIPNNEEEFLDPGEPDEVEIINVFLENESGRERQLDPIQDWLYRIIEEKILEQETYGV